MNVNCPNCGQSILHDASLAGQVIACPSCEDQFQMPPVAPPVPSATKIPNIITAPHDATHRQSKMRNRRKDRSTVYMFGGLLVLSVVAALIVGLLVGRSGSSALPVDAAASRQQSPPHAASPLAEEPAHEQLTTRLPEIDKTKFSDLVRAAARVQSATTTGVNLADYKNVVRDLNTELRTARVFAQSDAEQQLLQQFQQACQTFEDAIALWDEKQQLEIDRIQRNAVLLHPFGYIPVSRNTLKEIARRHNLTTQEKDAPSYASGNTVTSSYVEDTSINLLMSKGSNQIQNCIDTFGRH